MSACIPRFACALFVRVLASDYGVLQVLVLVAPFLGGKRACRDYSPGVFTWANHVILRTINTTMLYLYLYL